MAWLVILPAALAMGAAAASAERVRLALLGPREPPPYRVEGPYMVSVVIPAYNEEALLPKALSSIKNQTYEPLEAVVAVDHRTTDRTRELAASHGAVVVEVEQAGVGAARDAGSAAASGEILLHMDADTVWGHRVVEEVVRELEAGADVVHVPSAYDVWPRPAADLFAAIRAHRAAYWMTDGRCLGVWRGVHAALGGFLGLETSETYAFGLRAHKHGYRVVSRPDLPVATIRVTLPGRARAKPGDIWWAQRRFDP